MRKEKQHLLENNSSITIENNASIKVNTNLVNNYDTKNLPRLIDPKDIRKYFGCSDKKLYDLLGERTFPSVKFGRRYYILLDDFIEWLDKETHKQK